MRSITLLPILLSLVSPAYAFIGITLEMYNPSCAYACRSVIASAMIDCAAEANHSGPAHQPDETHNMTMMKRHGDMSEVTPECRSTSIPFLTTLAYCIHEKCFPEFKPTRAKLETYWYAQSTGDEAVEPMWGYQETYDRINGTPTATYDSEAMMLNGTVLIDKGSWQAEKQSMEQFEWQETFNSRYCLTLFLVGVGIPILLKLLGYLPFANSLAQWLKPRYIYPTLISRHVQPLFNVFHVPTLGQAIFIGFFTILTIVLTAVEHNSVSPNTWFSSPRIEIMAYVADRTGALSMALLPLTILFAGRNNILLWLTNWSHSTYLIHHRWIARLCAIQIILHSLLELRQHVEIGDYTGELKELYWIWGCVGTVAVAIMVIAAQFRRYYYEIFLITHILLAIFVIVGTWYHLEYLFQRKWAYEYWIYLCCAIWFFDRIIRLGRIFKVGVKRAVLTPIGDEVIRVDIPGVRWSVLPGHHAYLYLPATRKWAPWENHPFSVIPTSLLAPHTKSGGSSDLALSPTPSTPDVEKSEKNLTTPLPYSTTFNRSTVSTTGITLFIKRRGGITTGFTSSTLTALLDGPYRNTSSRPILDTDRLVLFAGGIGITGILPFVHAHPNVKIYWSVRSAQAALVDELQPNIPGHVERSILIGERNNIEVALAEEVKAGWGTVGVVVCGPGGMCDEMRGRVSWLGKNYPQTKFELDVEAFLW